MRRTTPTCRSDTAISSKDSGSWWIPEAGLYKTVDDFVNEGMDGPAAIKATGEQFRGKRLATLNEGGIRGFIAIALESADDSRRYHN